MVKKNTQKTVIILNKIYINYSEILLPMKKTGLLIIFFVLLSVFASANTVEENLYEKNSLEVPGYNITLLSIANDEKSIVICINNEKKILNKKSRLILENLKIEPTYIYEKYAKVKAIYSCIDCECDESCSNNLCFGETKNEEFNQTVEVVPNEEAKEKESGIGSLSTFLFIIVLALLIILLIKKRRGR